MTGPVSAKKTICILLTIKRKLKDRINKPFSNELEKLREKGLSNEEAKSYIDSRKTQEKLNDQMKAHVKQNKKQNENGRKN